MSCCSSRPRSRPTSKTAEEGVGSSAGVSQAAALGATPVAKATVPTRGTTPVKAAVPIRGTTPVAKAPVPTRGTPPRAVKSAASKTVARTKSPELKHVKGAVEVRTAAAERQANLGHEVSATPEAHRTNIKSMPPLPPSASLTNNAVPAQLHTVQTPKSMPPLPRSSSLTKDALLEQLQNEQTPSWMGSRNGTPQSARSKDVLDSPLATPKSASPPPAELKTPDWLAVLKSQGLAASSVTDSMRELIQPPPHSSAKSVQAADNSVAEDTEKSNESEETDYVEETDESDESASEEDQEWHSVREIPPEQLSPAAPVSSPVADQGTMLCKIDVAFNSKFGEWNSLSQGKLYAQLIAAGTDETFAKKVVIAMKDNKGKVSVRGPMVNHAPAYTVFRSIPALDVGLQTPSKVDQSVCRHGKAAPPPLRSAGPCAVTRLPGQPKTKQKPKKMPESKPKSKFGILRRNKNGIPIVKARVISPPRGTVARLSSASSANSKSGVDSTTPTRGAVKPISAARSLFDRNGRPRGDPDFIDTPLSRSSSNSSETSVYTPGDAQVTTPKIGVRALRSPARLVAESFQHGVKLQGREFKVLAEVTVTKLVMPSSAEVATLQPGQLVVAIDNQWWHGPRIKLQLPGADGSQDGGTGWASLCSTHGEYMLIPVVDVATAADIEQSGDENAASASAASPTGSRSRSRKTRRVLGLVQDENGVQQHGLRTPHAMATKLATNSRPVSQRVTPGREGDI